jgi:putative aminopeptidase FrvX
MRDELTRLLNRLLVTHSPPGDEREMDEACREELGGLCARVWQDEAGNVIGLLPGKREGSPLRVMAHKDEIGCLVARIEDNGKMRLEPLGGAVPWAYGEGPLDVLGKEVVTGVLGVGSMHTSDLSPEVHAAKHSRPLSWDTCRLDCKLSREQLAQQGVTVGSRVCVSRSRKQPLRLGDFVAGYALDDKAAVAVMLLAARMLKAAGRKPAQDTYLCMTAAEETGIAGGAFAAHTLPGDVVLSVEIAPVAPEYPVEPGPNPVILYKDAVFIYDKGLSDELCAVASRLGLEPQRMAVRCFGSDSSSLVRYGLAGKVAAIGFPTENTHGCEITHLDALLNCAALLAAYAAGGPPGAPRPAAKKGAKKRG